MPTNQVFDELKMFNTALADKALKVHLVSHPLVREILGIIRDEKTSQAEFRSAVHMLAPHLIYAATCDLHEQALRVSTPLAPILARRVLDKIVLLPILRSGLGMLEPAQKIFPHATTICAGVKRDEATATPNWYRDLEQLPGLKGGDHCLFLILDPMLATGGSSIEVIGRVKKYYPKAKIKMIVMISAPEGIKALNQAFPDVEITTAAVDSHLNEKKYIVPGLGDAGDRQFGTL